MTKHVFPIVILLACLAPNIGLGGLVGEPAPPLNVSEWIKGKPVEVKAGTNIFVVEIWETKSANSASITNLNEIQRRFKTNGVVVVAVSDEPAGKIKEFVQHDGSNIEYAVAADNKRHTSLTYMKPDRAAGNSICVRGGHEWRHALARHAPSKAGRGSG